MSEFLKPQIPIKHKKEDAYIYPLTTADQVILEDNTRLNATLQEIFDKLESGGGGGLGENDVVNGGTW